MKIVSFRIRKSRNIQDSGEIRLDDDLTCVVGKNQSGKTALLRALHKFNPHEIDPYDLRREWPRGERRQKDEHQIVSEVKFLLDEDERDELAALASEEMTAETVVVTKDYAGNFEIDFPDQPNLFPEQLHPNRIDEICAAIPQPTEPVGDDFRKAAEKCAVQVRRLAREGRFTDLSSVHTDHNEKLQAAITPSSPAPQNENETAFISAYMASLNQIRAELNAAPTMYHQAHDYIISNLPTFIYMDHYRDFEGTAILDQVLARRPNQLSERDKTFLMILKLSGLDLEDLVAKGKSGDPETIRERQYDLEDAARTLTKDVAGRWGQNPYRVQFRVDGQNFFTEIEEVNKEIGMIPLEEQSMGFRWFFSFDLRFMHDSDGAFEGCVLLLDEPGLHLHPGGQADLLARLDAYAEKNALIYTTHLPFLIDLREPSRIRVISQTDDGAIVSEDLGSSQADEKLTLQAALGMSMSQNYLVAQKNLVVEGAHDCWIITELSNLFERSGLPAVPDDVQITGTWGASGVVTVATFMIGQELDVLALFDSDSEGRGQEERLRTKWITRYKDANATTLLLGDALGLTTDITIEDLFPKDYYQQKLRDSHGAKIKYAGLTPGKVRLRGHGPIEASAKEACQRVDLQFNKGSVAKLIRRELVTMKDVAELPPSIKKNAEKLIEVIKNHFT